MAPKVQVAPTGSSRAEASRGLAACPPFSGGGPPRWPGRGPLPGPAPGRRPGRTFYKTLGCGATFLCLGCVLEDPFGHFAVLSGFPPTSWALWAHPIREASLPNLSAH